MKKLLKMHLSPQDDGRAFTDAVLLRAAGALHRRQAAAQLAAEGAPWAWLAAWARPWLIAAIIGLSLAITLPGLRLGGPSISPAAELTADVMGASTATAYVLAETVGN
jgi:ABC-type phosphate transport system auxiliary subunit